MQYFSILTTIGLNKLIKATTNSEQIILSKMGVSDDMGEISQDMQTLPNQKHKFSINSITQSDTDANVLICEGVISADVGGFYIRKIGIYTSDDKLFAVGNIPESYKPLLADGSAKDITIKFYLQVDNSANITLKVDNNIVLATRNYVKDEIKKLNSELNAKFLPLHAKADDSHKLDGKDGSEYALKSELSDGLPIGAYLSWSSQAKTPIGFLVCDGRSLNKSEYAELFEVIGYTYGGSDESFNIPNFNDGRFMRSVGGNASALGQLQQDAIRNITGKFAGLDNESQINEDATSGAFYHDKETYRSNATDQNASNGLHRYFYFDASRVTNTANENRPLNSSVIVLIKAKNVHEPKSDDIDTSIYATQTKPGITKLKNSISGSAQDTAVTENAVKNYVDESLKELINQSYQDVTNERNIDIVYTNTTNKAIFIILTLSNQRSGIVRASVYINDMLVGGMGADSGNAFSMSFLIPPNATYKVTQENLNGYSTASNLRVVKWLELR